MKDSSDAFGCFFVLVFGILVFFLMIWGDQARAKGKVDSLNEKLTTFVSQFEDFSSEGKRKKINEIKREWEELQEELNKGPFKFANEMAELKVKIDNLEKNKNN